MSKDKTEGRGSCLCGGVSFIAPQMSLHVGACHCRTCRTWGGGPFMGVECGPEVAFEGLENVAVFNSSDWAERGFCKQCGTHLFYRLKETGQHHMPAGLFGEVAGQVFDAQVFVDQKPGYYSFSNPTSHMTGPELFALFAPPDKS